MTTISVIIATYGDMEWERLAITRAAPTAATGEAEIILEHHPKGTRATSLNDGAAAAEGEWLLFLDADDELAPGYVGAMRRAVEQHEADGANVLFTPAVQQIRKGRPGAPFFFPEVDLAGGNWLVIGTMISRSLFNEIGGFREHPHGLEDWNLWNRAVRAGARIVKVPDAVYRAHVNPRSAHHRFQRDRRAYMVAYEIAKADV